MQGLGIGVGLGVEGLGAGCGLGLGVGLERGALARLEAGGAVVLGAQLPGLALRIVRVRHAQYVVGRLLPRLLRGRVRGSGTVRARARVRVRG